MSGRMENQKMGAWVLYIYIFISINTPFWVPGMMRYAVKCHHGSRRNPVFSPDSGSCANLRLA